jgi:hypothetical protein
MPGHLSDELLKIYEQALSEYRAKNFHQAKGLFNQCLKINPEDGPSKLYADRCDVFIEFPPPEDWDGVFTMTSK